MTASVNPALFFSILIPGVAASLAALALRRAEGQVPDPDDIHVRGGLDHMLVGLIAGLALTAFLFLAFVLRGALLAIAIAAAAMLVLRALDFGARLIPFYRLQLSLAAAALLAALILWLATLNVIQGVPHA